MHVAAKNIKALHFTSRSKALPARAGKPSSLLQADEKRSPRGFLLNFITRNFINYNKLIQLTRVQD
jgi:hypothetical protein